MEKVNLIQILKNAPRGTKLYSPICGDIYLDRVSITDGQIHVSKMADLPIQVEHGDEVFLADGSKNKFEGSECLLFPSKDWRSWAPGWQLYLFKPGDIIVTDDMDIVIYAGRDSGFSRAFYKDGTNKPVRLDKCEYGSLKEATIIFNLLESKGMYYNKHSNSIDRTHIEYFDDDSGEVNLKELPKLKPFDKVLVRNFNNEKWECDLFQWYMKDSFLSFKTVVKGSSVLQCIPYDDDTKELLGTTKMPPERYISWKTTKHKTSC